MNRGSILEWGMFRNPVFFVFVSLLSASGLPGSEVPQVELEIETKVILKREKDDEPLWFHPRVGIFPSREETGNPLAVMTLQKLLGRSDFYSGLSVMVSTDLGGSWSTPETPSSLAWRKEDEVSIAVADVTPGFHTQSGTILAVGAQIRYSIEGEQRNDRKRSHETAYAVCTRDGNWQSWKTLQFPADAIFDFARSACAQWLEEKDGTVLLPCYVRAAQGQPFSTVVIRCSFDGKELRYLEHGNFLALNVKRGLYEPSLIRYAGRYFLTMRNDEAAYVSVSEDGRNFSSPKPWTFDDGGDLGSYNTQAHWLTVGGGLFLSYTRRGAENDHVMRHRAPIFVGQVNPDALEVIRATEKIVVPERGASLGNFGATRLSETEAWITVAEGNVTEAAKKRGASGSVFLARVRARGSSQ